MKDALRSCPPWSTQLLTPLLLDEAKNADYDEAAPEDFALVRL